MSIEQGFIQYNFEQRGADALQKHVDDIADSVKAGATTFDTLESAIKSVISVAPEMGSSLKASMGDDYVLQFIGRLDQVKQKMADLQSEYRTGLSADAIGAPGIATPNPSRSTADEMVRLAKAGNASIVADTESAYRKIAAASKSILETASERAFSKRKAEVGEVAALEERAAKQAALVRRGTAAVEEASRDRTFEGLQQQASATELLARRHSDLAKTEKDLGAARERQSKAEAARLQGETQALATEIKARASEYDKLKQARDSAEGEYTKEVKKQTESNTASQIGREAEARARLVKYQREQATAEREIARLRARGGNSAAQVQAEATAYRNASAAAKEVARAQRDVRNANEGIISQRYALYDISNMYALIGAAATGAGIYAVTMAAQFETAFTAVERTLDPMEVTAQGVDDMRQSLVQLQGQIPLTFAELSKIATIGNQMGIAAEDLMGFTGTVARFSSVSGMSIEEVTKAFGGLMAQTGLSADYLENLGSAIALVGIKSNASEAEILAISTQIGTLSANAGLGIDQIIGLAGTMASLRIAPERARGSLDTYFGTLRKAVAGGGDDLKNFALVVGETSDELERMVRAGEGDQILGQFLENLNKTDAVGVTQALDALNLSQLRVDNTFTALSRNVDMFNGYMSLSRDGFLAGSELNRQYEKTIDDVNSQWIIFTSGLNSLIDAVTGGAIPSLAGLLSMVNKLMFGFQAFLNDNPWASKMLLMGFAVVSVIGVMALLRAAMLRAQAGVLAFRIATQQAATLGIQATGVFRTLAGALVGVGNGARAGASGLRMFRAALVSTGVGALIAGVGFLAEKFIGMGDGVDDAAIGLDEYNKAMAEAESSMKSGGEGAIDFGDKLGGGGGNSVAGGAEKAVEKIRTLIDYANDLSGVLGRSFTLRFGVEQAEDAVTKMYNEIRKANEDAKDQITQLREKFSDLGDKINESRLKLRELNADLKGLTADLSMQKYFLDIAIEYGDDKRAEQLRAQIAKTEADIAKKRGDITDETKKITKSENERADMMKEIARLQKEIDSKPLTGNTDAALKNRDAVRGLVDAYGAQIKALAESGLSQEAMSKKAKELRDDFLDQGEKLGFSRDELGKYASGFDDLVKVIDTVPRNITPSLDRPDLGPAELALAEFFAKAKEDAAAAGAGAGGDFGDGFDSSLDGGLGYPEITGDAEADGKETGKKFIDGVAYGIGEWIGGLTKKFTDWAKELPGKIAEFFNPTIIGNGFSIGKNPFLAPVTKWFSGAGTEGGKELTKGAAKETEKLHWSTLFSANTLAGLLTGWNAAGEDGGKSYNDGVSESANPDGSISDKLPSGSGGGGGGAGSIAGMGRLGEISTEEFNRKVGSKANPEGSIGPRINGSRTGLSTLFGTLAGFGMASYNTAMGNKANASGVLGSNASGARSNVKARMDSVGGSGGSSYNSGLGGKLNTSGIISSDINGSKTAAGISADSLGQAIGSAISGGVSWILDILMGGSGTKSRKIIKKLTGFSGGGYTGPGGWLQPAGIVHRGEYVIPKRHVDQRTKLPDMSYVQSLHNGKSAPKLGYATGGPVGGSGDAIPVQVVNPVDLGARSLNALGQMSGGGGQQLSDAMIGGAASRSYQQGTLVGSG